MESDAIYQDQRYCGKCEDITNFAAHVYLNDGRKTIVTFCMECED